MADDGSLATGNPVDAPHAAAPLRKLGHEPVLDGIRAVAILAVLFDHQMDQELWLQETIRGMHLGVDVFFVLSGFLITALLMGEQAASGRIRFGAFYRRRALRLLPALVVFLAAYLVYARLADLPWPLATDTVIATLLYHANWKIVWDLSISEGLGHMWSLSVEEQFYLLWPCVVALCLGVRRMWSIPILVLGVVAVAVWRLHLWNQGEPWLFLFVRTDTRADALLMGALAAHLWVKGLVPQRGLAIAAWASCAVFGFAAIRLREDEPFFYQGGFTLIALCIAIMLLASLERRWVVHRALRTQPMATIGLVSYGLYLWHWPIFNAVGRFAPGWPPALRAVTGLGTTVAVVASSWFLIERPALALKARLEAQDRLASPSGPS